LLDGIGQSRSRRLDGARAGLARALAELRTIASSPLIGNGTNGALSRAISEIDVLDDRILALKTKVHEHLQRKDIGT